MANLLIRCSLPDRLPADDLREWLHARRRTLVCDPEVDEVVAGPIGPATWVLEMQVGVDGHDTVAGLLGDLRLLGLDPMVFRPERVAGSVPDPAAVTG